MDGRIFAELFGPEADTSLSNTVYSRLTPGKGLPAGSDTHRLDHGSISRLCFSFFYHPGSQYRFDWTRSAAACVFSLVLRTHELGVIPAREGAKQLRFLCKPSPRVNSSVRNPQTGLILNCVNTPSLDSKQQTSTLLPVKELWSAKNSL